MTDTMTQAETNREVERWLWNYGETPTTVTEFINGYSRHFELVVKARGDYRRNQAVMNYLSFHFPDVMPNLYGTRFDVFYSDSEGRRGDLIAYLADTDIIRWA